MGESATRRRPGKSPFVVTLLSVGFSALLPSDLYAQSDEEVLVFQTGITPP
jgi:hypothetical protein